MLTRIQTSLKDLFAVPRISPRTIPWFIFGIAFFALGITTLNLGYFQDDWHHVYYFFNAGFQGIRQFLFVDSRPLAYVVYDTLFSLLGVNPFWWHFSIFVVRTLTTLVFLGILNIVWPGYYKENAMAGILFLLYPVYLLQPLSVAYALHWTMYLVCMLSILTMLFSLQQQKYSIIYSIASFITQIFHLLMIEYYFGVELLRPIFLWLFFRDLTPRQRLKRAFSAWSPYLIVDIAYGIYRASYEKIFGFERFDGMTFFVLLKQPLSLLAFYFRAGLQDFTEILLASWYETLKPALFDFSSPSRILIWILVLAAVFGVWSYLKLLRGETHTEENESAWARQILGVGFLAVLFGILPGWVVGNTVFGSNPLWNDRFAMAAMFGAGMVWTGVIFLLVPKPNHRYLIFSILISLAIGINLRTQMNFKYAWEKQLNFYWQLSWRAPYIEPHTLLISDGEFLSYMGTSPSSFALNTLYPQSLPLPQAGYWMANGPDHLPEWDEFRSGSLFEFQRYASTFSGNTADSVTIRFMPEENQCLWILPPEYADIRFLTPAELQSLPVSSMERIQAEPLNGQNPSAQIFGSEPKHTWCYYFQKGDLAAQYKNWSRAVELWQEAQGKDLRPGHGLEYFPFIRAYAYTDQWETAVSLSITSSKITRGMAPPVCDLWNRIKNDSADTAARQDAFRKINERFQCGL